MRLLPLPALLVLSLGALVVLGTRFGGPGAQVEDAEARLRGTWVREYSEKGVQVRRTLSLQGGGSFREEVRIVDAAGRVTQQEHAGTWLYDGTNLKRRYTLMNGEPPSRLRVPFATFEVSFDSANEFSGLDRVHGHRVRYRRTGFGGTP